MEDGGGTGNTKIVWKAKSKRGARPELWKELQGDDDLPYELKATRHSFQGIWHLLLYRCGRNPRASGLDLDSPGKASERRANPGPKIHSHGVCWALLGPPSLTARPWFHGQSAQIPALSR